MAGKPIALRTLLRQKHWTYATFCSEYGKIAKSLDAGLTGSWPSRAQYQRWLAGELRTLPYPDACRVLEAMFPGWTIDQLFSPAAAREDRSHELADADQTSPALGGAIKDLQLSDLTAVYATRSEFLSAMPVHTIFDRARVVHTCGLSLNILCQHYSAQKLIKLIEDGTQIRCLFLDPAGKAIAAREQEENYPHGQLSDLTQLNIQTLQERVRDRLTPTARDRFELGTYDQTIRFNIILIDDDLGIVQPYMPAARGVDSPTFVLQRQWSDQGLLPMFEQVFCSLWEARRPI